MANYDHRVRPPGPGATQIGVSTHVIAIDFISERNMNFTVDLYFRQQWRDSRLAFPVPFDHVTKTVTNHVTSDHVTSLNIAADQMSRLWLPDTFFPNAIRATFHSGSTHAFLRIGPDGTVFMSVRLELVTRCRMNFRAFPFDKQQCFIQLESYGHGGDQIGYYWLHGEADSFSVDGLGLPPGYRVYGFRTTTPSLRWQTNLYSRLEATLFFVRKWQPYLAPVFLPTALAVAVSWFAFFLPRQEATSRVVVGLVTPFWVLYLWLACSEALPRVSYIKVGISACNFTKQKLT